ncbi:hypothetical protein KP509_23G013900 [Ceratopteris richardii]|uniref:SBP-type domain-containing protein n=1 Tax=Ceratopteris richardii TaxID=49495 RepID=A0A8T2RXQ6_CERRI|nr:hypothetical protein KP509_23G013900 [Ceratopteris richardii]KAH7301132.1 hypothetical protein KP509_23G013900 [Ceratopteris richardii]
MNPLRNLNSAVNGHDDVSFWPSDDGWRPPATTICSGIAADSRLEHQQNIYGSRQEWEWSANQTTKSIALHDENVLDYTPANGLQMDNHPLRRYASTMTGQGMRHHNADLLHSGAMAAPVQMIGNPSVSSITSGGDGVIQQNNTWPMVLDAVPLRQQDDMPMDHSGALISCYSGSTRTSTTGSVGDIGSVHSNVGLFCYNESSEQGHIELRDMEQRQIHDMIRTGMLHPGAQGIGGSRLGLNLGGRTYFSNEDYMLGARVDMRGGYGVGRRFRSSSPSFGHVPSCQAEGCKADLSMSKHYHRRHKVCEYHSKSATVFISGKAQRFCQQCSRFHALTEFDEGKRSCRKRLEDHNRRRRKPQPTCRAAELLSESAKSTPDSNPITISAIVNSPESDRSSDRLQNVEEHRSAPENQCEEQGSMETQNRIDACNFTSSSSSTEQQSSMLSTITLTPAMSFALENGAEKFDRNRQTQSSNVLPCPQELSNDSMDTKLKNGMRSTPRFLLNAPSLSLSSSNSATNVGVTNAGGDSLASTDADSPVHITRFNLNDQLEPSIPWQRSSSNHMGSSPMMGLVQQCLNKSSSHNQTDSRSIVTNFGGGSGSRKRASGQYLNEHGRLLAKHIQTLQVEAAHAVETQEKLDSVSIEKMMKLESPVGNHNQKVLRLLEAAASTRTTRREQLHEENEQITSDRHSFRLRTGEHVHGNVEEGCYEHQFGFLQEQDHHHQYLREPFTRR